MSILSLSVGARMPCEHADCRNFPRRLIKKAQLNFTAFCQASAARAFYAMHADVGPARAVSDCIIGAKTRKNPVLARNTVSMLAKICVH
jgi:hypothetical protein